MTKTKAHIRYKNKDNVIVPGVSTITKELGWNREVLCKWNNKMGLNGIDTQKYVSDKADIGTLAHKFITDGLQNIKTDTSDYSKNQIEKSENSVISFYEWEKTHTLEPILIEKQLVSEKYLFGGTLDLYGRVNKIFELDDIKTGSGIYEEQKVQLSGYWLLLLENGYTKPDIVRIINIPRSEDERFDDPIIYNIEIYAKIFLNCLSNYYLKKQAKNKSNGDKDDFYQFVRKESSK